MLRNYFSRFYILCFVTLFIASCGGGGDSSTNNPPSVTSKFITFNFTAKVEQIGGIPPFPVAIGDKMTGTFVYPLDASDSNIENANQGYFYHLESPSSLHFQLSTIDFSSGQDEMLIQTWNDDFSNKMYMVDTFLLYAFSSKHSEMVILFSMNDVTGTVFTSDTCNSLPNSLSLNSFKSNYIQMQWISPETGAYVWSVRLVPDSLIKQ